MAMQEHTDDFSWGADTLASGQDASLLLSGVEEGSARRSQSPVPAPQLAAAEGGFLGSLLSCFSIDQLKPYFDVNDVDIYERALHVLKLRQTPFLAAEGQQPDLYGPVWASTSLVFLLAVVGNIAAWEHSKPPDIRIIMTALGLVYGYVLVGGGALFGASKWLGLGVGLVRAISLYGA
eukprot:864-Heterococcus_DN1.PRE.2